MAFTKKSPLHLVLVPLHYILLSTVDKSHKYYDLVKGTGFTVKYEFCLVATPANAL